MTRCAAGKKLRMLVLGVLCAVTISHALGQSDETQASRTVSPVKRYENAVQRIAFDYPPSWKVIEDASSGGAVFALRLLGSHDDIPIMRERSPGAFAVAVFANPHRLEAREWLNANGWPFGSERSAQHISIAGRGALDVSTNRMFAPNRFVYLADGDRMIRLAPIAAQSQAVLSSFRLNP